MGQMASPPADEKVSGSKQTPGLTKRMSPCGVSLSLSLPAAGGWGGGGESDSSSSSSNTNIFCSQGQRGVEREDVTL